jgi:hypothetical protein
MGKRVRYKNTYRNHHHYYNLIMGMIIGAVWLLIFAVIQLVKLLAT